MTLKKNDTLRWNDVTQELLRPESIQKSLVYNFDSWQCSTLLVA